MSVISLQITLKYISVSHFDIKTGEVNCYVENINSNEETKSHYTKKDDNDVDHSFNDNNSNEKKSLFPKNTFINPESSNYLIITMINMILESFSNISTIVISSQADSIWKHSIEHYSKLNGCDIVVLPQGIFSNITGLHHSKNLENSFILRFRKTKDYHSLSWKSQINILRSNFKMLESFGALLQYLIEKGDFFYNISSEKLNTPNKDSILDMVEDINNSAVPLRKRKQLNEVDSPKLKDKFNNDSHLPLDFVSNIKCKIGGELLLMDKHTFNALKVFNRERSLFSNSKENTSLFNILNYTQTQMGKDLLKLWMKKPTRCLKEIKLRHQGIEFFMNEKSLKEFVGEILLHIKGIKDLKKITHRMHLGRSTVRDWYNLFQSLVNFEKIFSILKEVINKFGTQIPCIFNAYPNSSFEENNEILEVLIEEVLECIQLLSKTIDWNESKFQNRIIILTGVDKEVDHLKNIYEGLDELLNKVAIQEIQKLPSSFNTIACAYFPQVGFLIQIPYETISSEANLVDIHESLEYRFKTDDSVYYKNEAMKELDVSIGDIHGYIVDKEEEVVREIEKYLLNNESSFSLITEIIARIDCIISFSRAASELNLIKPVLNEDSTIMNITNGRNILLEQAGQNVIENSVISNENSRRLHIITGANGSGKSAYLREIGTITYLSFIGSFVPCESAEIGEVDQIMSKIQSYDSVVSQMSSFTFDLKLINNILQSYTRSSLILLDEFGKGSLALDGICLLGSILNYFISENREIDCPRIFVTTHYTELFDTNIVPIDNILVQLLKTETTFVQNKENNVDTQLVYLYKIVPCRKPDYSYGISCAQNMGIPKEIIARAIEIKPMLENHAYIEPMKNKLEKTFEECLDLIEIFLNTRLDDKNSIDNLFLKVNRFQNRESSNSDQFWDEKN